MPQRTKRSPPKRESKGGGIIRSRRGKSWIVNIRPPSWENEKFWIGKFETFEAARPAADAVFYYVGKLPFHFKDVVRTYPSLECMGTVIDIPEKLSNQDMFFQYITKIAKGANFQRQRKDFIRQVQNVIGRTDFPFRTVIDDDDSYREEGVPPPEFDEHTAKTLHMSSHPCSSDAPATVVPTHAAGFDAVCGSDALQGFVASFEFSTDDSENILRSAEHPLGQVHFSPNDCPITDEKELRLWYETVDSLNNPSGI